METIKPDLKKAIKAIKEGKVLVCPTDTVYGLICDAKNKKAIERLYQIKKRPKWKLLPIFVKDIKMAKGFVKINPEQEKFLKKVWPGAVTAVLEKKKSAVRIPRYKFIIDLIKRIGRPLAESSANISDRPASTKIKEVLNQFKGRKYHPDLVIDAGDLKKSRPSMVIDLTVLPPRTLRD